MILFDFVGFAAYCYFSSNRKRSCLPLVVQETEREKDGREIMDLTLHYIEESAKMHGYTSGKLVYLII